MILKESECEMEIQIKNHLYVEVSMLGLTEEQAKTLSEEELNSLSYEYLKGLIKENDDRVTFQVHEAVLE